MRGGRLLWLLGIMPWPTLSACTVFYAFDGENALAGDNEDWIDRRTQIWFIPATDRFGTGRGVAPGRSSRKIRPMRAWRSAGRNGLVT